jgi:hypothetical protein
LFELGSIKAPLAALPIRTTDYIPIICRPQR